MEAAKYFNMRILTSQHRKKQSLLVKIDKEIKDSKQINESDKNKENVRQAVVEANRENN